MPLIPLNNGHCLVLNSSLPVVKGETLYAEEETLVDGMGITVVHNLPSYATLHPSVSQYVTDRNNFNVVLRKLKNTVRNSLRLISFHKKIMTI